MKHKRIIAIAGIALAVLALPHLIFFARAPMLVVTDASFVALYGLPRIKRQQTLASRALFRRVKPVMVADGASPDIIVVAVSSAATRPFCVLFPRYQAPAAQRYHQDFPKVPVVLLGEAVPASRLPSSDGLLYVYETDRNTDMYRAGLCAGILANLSRRPADESPAPRRTFVLWQNPGVTDVQRNLFSLGARERHPDAGVVFVRNVGEMPGGEGLSCAVLTAAGAEYFESNPKIPIILLSWLEPAMMPQEVAILFDDSPWALVVPAAKMAKNRQNEGKIPSKPLIIPGKVADNGIFRALRRAARRMP